MGRASLHSGRGTTVLLAFTVVFLGSLLGIWLTDAGLLRGILP